MLTGGLGPRHSEGTAVEQKTGVHLAGTVAVGGASLPPHRTHVVLCLRRHHPAAALPNAGRSRLPLPLVPQNALGEETGRCHTLEVQRGGAGEKGHPAALGGPAIPQAPEWPLVWKPHH